MKSIVLKPWGSFQIIEESIKYVIKKIIVKPKGSLSLQSHKYRSEHWIVVQGQAEVILNEDTKTLNANENIYIPVEAKHRLTNNTSEDLIIVEVWYGDRLEEDDITRYEDIYNRD